MGERGRREQTTALIVTRHVVCQDAPLAPKLAEVGDALEHELHPGRRAKAGVSAMHCAHGPLHPTPTHPSRWWGRSHLTSMLSTRMGLAPSGRASPSRGHSCWGSTPGARASSPQALLGGGASGSLMAAPLEPHGTKARCMASLRRSSSVWWRWAANRRRKTQGGHPRTQRAQLSSTRTHRWALWLCCLAPAA
jgi:hypothetical protein